MLSTGTIMMSVYFEYVQCYYQAFGLGMLFMLMCYELKRKWYDRDKTKDNMPSSANGITTNA
jgi:hypothetical protein